MENILKDMEAGAKDTRPPKTAFPQEEATQVGGMSTESPSSVSGERTTVPPKPPTGGTAGEETATGLPGASGWRHLPRGTVRPREGRSSFPQSSEQIGTAEQRAAGEVRVRGERLGKGEVGTKATEVPEGRAGLRDHWVQHGREFPEYRNACEYEQGAIRFCLDPTTRRHYYRYYGRPTIGYYNVETNTFAATSVDGETIYTYFRPDKGVEDLIRKTRMPEAATGESRTMAPGVTPRHSVPLRQD